MARMLGGASDWMVPKIGPVNALDSRVGMTRKSRASSNDGAK